MRCSSVADLPLSSLSLCFWAFLLDHFSQLCTFYLSSSSTQDHNRHPPPQTPLLSSQNKPQASKRGPCNITITFWRVKAREPSPSAVSLSPKVWRDLEEPAQSPTTLTRQCTTSPTTERMRTNLWYVQLIYSMQHVTTPLRRMLQHEIHGSLC